MKNILMVGAHFDDVDLACGGTAAKLVALGMRVYKLTLTDNVTQFHQKEIYVDFDSSQAASNKLCKLLGITEINDFPHEACNHLSYSKELMQRIEKIIIDLQIDTVFTHFPEDMNTDHVEASKLCLTAARHCDNILYYQSNAYLTMSPFSPNYFVDITEFVDLKRKGLEFYPPEHNRFGRLFSTNFDRERTYGFLCNREYCEGFVLLKKVD